MTVLYLYIMQKAIAFGTSSWNYVYVSEGPRTQPLLRIFTANKLSLLDGTYPRTFLVSCYYDCAVGDDNFFNCQEYLSCIFRYQAITIWSNIRKK